MFHMSLRGSMDNRKRKSSPFSVMGGSGPEEIVNLGVSLDPVFWSLFSSG